MEIFGEIEKLRVGLVVNYGIVIDVCVFKLVVKIKFMVKWFLVGIVCLFKD